MDAAIRLGPRKGLHGRTYWTLFGLLAATGLRISEGLALHRGDVDLDRGLITVRRTKFFRERVVPLHPTAVEALRRYAGLRDRRLRPPVSPQFFLTEMGTPLTYARARLTFVNLRSGLRWVHGRNGRLPRVHDLRHTFAVRRLIQWYRDAQNVDNKIAALATYLGHTRVSHTYWYLTGVPELFAFAVRRFERYAVGASRGSA